jgi:hypothetical protein
MPSAPDTISISRDDYLAEHVGRTPDGRQFFLTLPFDPSDRGEQFVALYLFDAAGRLLQAEVDALGAIGSVDAATATRRAACEARLRPLGPLAFGRIAVAPFSITRFGRVFGLVPRAPDQPGHPWRVEAEPGNYMAFVEPWDSGEYDT